MVLEAGLEPARMLLRGILSPLRLPIPPQRRIEFYGGATQIWTGGGGFAGPCLTAWLWRRFQKNPIIKKMERETRFELATFALARQRSTTEPFPHIPYLGYKVWWEQQGSNLWPSACKADALPAELCFQVRRC